MYIPTYEKCLDIVNNNPDMCFYETKFRVDHYDISIFGYRYAKYNNFRLPLIEEPDIQAHELKGLSFIFNDDGSLFDHNLMLHKFWELDQYGFFDYDQLKYKKIDNITVKEDGFLLTFIKLPNNSILSQGKKGFGNKENKDANKFLNNEYYFNFINNCLDDRIQPIFEYVNSEFYVNYKQEDLILTKLRNKDTGEYLNISDFDTTGVSVVDTTKFKTFEELFDIRDTVTNIEGWIVQFDDGDMIKVKSKWWKNEKILRLLNKQNK